MGKARFQLQNVLSRIIAFIEFFAVYIKGNLIGISIVVRYLRNPNPLITVKVLRAFGAAIGEHTTFKRSIFIDNSYEDQNSIGDFTNLCIGSNCYIGDGVYFDLSNKIVIEDNVVVSGRVSFITHADCNRSNYLAERFPRQCLPIRIQSGSWIGFGSFILFGVTLGDRCVVAACSLIKDNVASMSVYAGIPAKRIRGLDVGDGQG